MCWVDIVQILADIWMAICATVQILANIVIAICAIGALFYSSKTLRIANKSHLEDQKRRRAFIALIDEPGYFKIPEIMNDSPVLSITLENYGINPAQDLELTLISINSSNLENPQLPPVFIRQCYVYNPIPNKAKWMIRIKRQTLEKSGITDFHIMLSSFLILRLKYYDKILGLQFEDTFYLYINEDEKLSEITKEQFDNIMPLLAKY